MHPSKSIYLAGPIVGVEYGEARSGWRAEFAAMMDSHPHIHCLSPMRGRALMPDKQVVAPGMEYQIDDPLENAKSMLARDTGDIRNCNLVVVNLLGAKRAALGTTAEMGFAYALNIPVLLIMERRVPVFHTHGFITGIASFWVDDLEVAAATAQTLLTPGV